MGVSRPSPQHLPSATPARRRLSSQARRGELLDAALREFSSRGYYLTQMEHVAATAGVSKALVYQHFASKEELLQALLADMHAQAGATFDDGGHPPHDLTDPAQLREHLAAGWGVMRDNRAVMTALFESAMAAGPASGALWERLAADTSMLREHLESLHDRGDAVPGDPTLIAAAIGGMLAMLAYALLPADPDAQAPAGQAAYSDAQILSTLTDLLSHGLAGPAARPPVPQ